MDIYQTEYARCMYLFKYRCLSESVVKKKKKRTTTKTTVVCCLTQIFVRMS